MGVCHKPLDGADVLLVPHVTFTSVLNGLGEAGQQAIIDWAFAEQKAEKGRKPIHRA